MHFLGSIMLLGLLVILQSQSAHAIFWCNESNKPMQTKGYCMITSDDWDFYKVEPARRAGKGKDQYTCDGVTIENKTIQSRWCCDTRPPPHPKGKYTASHAYFFKEEVWGFCYPRDRNAMLKY